MTNSGTTVNVEAIGHKMSEDGYAIIDDVFANEEIEAMLAAIAGADMSDPAFRNTGDLFAIRKVLQVIPSLGKPALSESLCALLSDIFGTGFFVVKSIYFDKPGLSNWFVAYHQDLTISVDRKAEIEGFSLWTVKQDQYAVQPPLSILEDNFTVRIHLDDTDEHNGALRVIPGSHNNGICRQEYIDQVRKDEVTCNVKKGAIMLMKPLLLHASGRTTNNSRRRVVHIEFSRSPLPEGINWAEYQEAGSQPAPCHKQIVSLQQ